MKIVLLVGILILVFGFECVTCDNVLVLMGVPTPSHFIWVLPVINKLAANGHNVTVLSVNVDPNPPENVTYIHMENTYNVLYGNGTATNNIMERSKDNPFEAVMSAYKFGILGCIGCTSSQGFQVLLNYPDDFRFDVVIYDCSAGPCILGFLHKFGYPPLISVSAFGFPPFSPLLVGGHKPSPYFALTYDSRMNFFERAADFLVQSFDSLYHRWVFLTRIQALAQSAFNFRLPNLMSVEKRTQLMLVNSNPILDSAELLPQNVIPVGGMQILDPKPLPQDIQSFIESSPKGVVLFAMGTNFKSKMLTRERQMMFVEAFSKLPEYNFLWKFDEEDLPLPTPPNVMIRKWLSQSDILAHPKTRAFITHCGLLGSYEATYHGVPVVAIPIYIDQHKNAARLVRDGTGLGLSMKTLSTDAIKETLVELLGNDTFRSNMRKKSELLRDQPEKPLDRAIWWIEWVLRHPHEYHSRSPTLDMDTKTLTNVDVIGFIIFIFAAKLYIFYRFIRCLKRVRQSNINNKKSQ